MNSLRIVSHIEIWPIDRLIPYARNVRTHSDKEIQELGRSIGENGFVNPVSVDQRGNVIAGHRRVLAAALIGLTHLPVIVLGYLTETQVRALRIADNRIAENAGWDQEILQAELAALLLEKVDLTSLGFAELELKKILEEFESQTASIDENEAPDPPDQPITKVGDYGSWGTSLALCRLHVAAVPDRSFRKPIRGSDLRGSAI
jgi:ParB-like chromosome segregation protein Spo0J